MRFAERFLLLLALIGLILRVSGSPQGPAMQLISAPPLALFYLLFSPSLLNAPWREHFQRPAPWKRIGLSILEGVLLSYCIISVLYAGLGSVPRQYAAESCGLTCAIILGCGFLLRNPELRPFRRGFLVRGAGISGFLAIVCLLPPAVLPGVR